LGVEIRQFRLNFGGLGTETTEVRNLETTTRFCPVCEAEVEAIDGFCMLGHFLKLESVVPEPSELRAEVDRAFEDARAEVAAALSDPEPAPDVVAIHEQRASLFASLGEDLPLGASDPIAAFAPPPRMDWGPERVGIKRPRFSFRRVAVEETAGS
jgi:hypothetical protein